MKIVLVRHGEIDSNLRHIYSGRSDEALNDTGIAQARMAAEQLADMQFAALFTSPLLRTRQTAAVLGERLSLVPIVSDAFNEIRMGPWQGLSEAEVAKRYPDAFTLWNTLPADLRLEGRETLQDVQDRAVAGVRQACSFAVKGDIAVVSHVAVIRTLKLYAAGRSLNEYKRVHVPNAAPMVIEWNVNG